jgi:putative glycosyltransferase (TIGR04348 family)
MNIFMACPAPPRSRKGNRVTAERWAGLLRGLGHRLTIGQDYDGANFDLLIALHARRSFPAVQRFRKQWPERPLIVALTGTDLYRDLPRHAHARRSLALADRLVVLQPCAHDNLPVEVRAKVRVIYQSARRLARRPAQGRRTFDVCLLGHLRHEKDPLRAALALRLIPPEVPLRVLQAGQALQPSLAVRARALMAREPRYRWLGEVSRGRARRLLAGSRLLVLPSRMEGGANVVSEAIVEGVPVLASDIPGNVGLLGKAYPGYFPVGDTRALAGLLRRVATEPAVYRELRQWCARLRPLFRPARERAAWDDLLRELQPRGDP